MAPPRLVGLTRRQLAAYVDDTWALENCLFDAFQRGETFYRTADPLRHPLVFYLGHSAAFFVDALRFIGTRTTPVHAHFDALFARGIDPVNPSAVTELDWPAVEAVRAYREQVIDAVAEAVASLEIPERVTPEDSAWAMMLAIEHARIHFETSSVLVRMLPAEDLSAPECWPEAPRTARGAGPEWVAVPAGRITLGKPADWPTFGWDNEYGSLTLDVPTFEARSTLVTNGEFRGFVESGGYRQSELWTAAGWRWRCEAGTERPRFWRGTGTQTELRTVFFWGPLALDWPVEVNRFEAEAYVRWRGAGVRLPNEAEQVLASRGAPRVDGDVMAHSGYNLNLRYGSPRAVGSDQTGRANSGLLDLHGNVWQWLSDDFRPLPGFRPHPLYPNFSTPYFDSEHGMMAGGSWASTGTSASRFYRLWFRPRMYQHAGLRLARDPQ